MVSTTCSPQRQVGAKRDDEQPGGSDQRQADVGDEQRWQFAVATIAHQPVAIEQRDGGAQAEQQPDCAGHPAGLQRNQGQRAESDEFAPGGMKMTRVTAKTRTSARASSA